MPKTDLEKAAKLGQRIVELNKAGDSEAAVALCDELLARFGTKHSQVDMRRQIARALAYKALSLAQLGRLDEAVEASDQLVMSFGGDHDGLIDRFFTGNIATLMVSQAMELDDNHLALQLCERYVPVLVDGSAASLPPDIVKLVGLQASLLADLERLDEARSAIDQFLALAEANPDPALDEHIENARELRDSLTEAAELRLAIDSTHGSDESVAKAALLDTVESWLSVPDGPGPVEAEIAFMRSCAALYREFCGRFPHLANDEDALLMLQSIAATTVRPAVGSRMPLPSEPVSRGLSLGAAEAIAAARLAVAGEALDVLITTSIMSQRAAFYHVWHPLCGAPTHLWVLPAICSALAPLDQFAGDALAEQVPLCTNHTGTDYYSEYIRLNSEVRATSVGLDDNEREKFGKWASDQYIEWAKRKEEWPRLVNEDEAAGVAGFFVMHELGIESDPSFLDQVLSEAREGDFFSRYNILLAHLFFWASTEALLLLDAPGDDLDTVLNEHPWILRWHPESLNDPTEGPDPLWPPDKAELQRQVAPFLKAIARVRRWSECQTAWTVAGQFNVESGWAAVASSVDYPSCDCYDSVTDGLAQPDCERCGRPAASRFACAAGAGDGIYPVYRLVGTDGLPHGAVAVFDQALAEQINVGAGSPASLADDGEPNWLGTIGSSGALSFSEATAGTDREDEVVTVALPAGTFHVVEWKGELTSYGMSWGRRTRALAVYDEKTMHVLEALTAGAQPWFHADE